MTSCFEGCCPCFNWCRKREVGEHAGESEPLIKRRDSYDRIKEKFHAFRKNVLENSLKDLDVAKEDIREVTLFLQPTGVGNVDAQLSGYVTLYNDHLERWKNIKKLLTDFRKSPVIAAKSRVVTFKNGLTQLHKICDDLKSKNGDLSIKSVSEFCLLVDYKPDGSSDDKSPENSAILVFNQISRDLREFIERGPSLARLLKSIAGGVRFREDTSPKRQVSDVKTDEVSEEYKDEDEEGTLRAEAEASSGETEEPRSGVCAEREVLDLSISNAGLSKARETVVMKRYKHNLELLGKGSGIVEVLDLAAKGLWQNIHDEMTPRDQ